MPESARTRLRLVRSLRVIAFLEGISYLALLGVAMPLKYVAGIPSAVRWTGLAHGILFMAFVAVLVQVAMAERWNARRIAFGLVAAVVPFGTFAFDRHLREDERRLKAEAP